MVSLKNAVLQGPLRALCILMTLAVVQPAFAQQLGLPQSGILTISSDRLFSESEFGKRVFQEIETEGAALAAENERIVEELSKEEKDLTEQRATLTAEEFRPLAEAFDEKVQSHREGQRAKLDALARRSEEARSTFTKLAEPILIGLLRDAGASMILERSYVFLSSDALDITDAAIDRIDTVIGDGGNQRIDGGE
ncbi:OmpH family outer membrane protein [Ruegeria arenilitoris]|uniref:OmpH family outer membrane protein n=2 Tax=Ruegeria arenilitoris TaxID=1173585 RepID=UPI00148062D0|nr:OmpH family outer membrane protein [Ruegeria arenilitoris]